MSLTWGWRVLGAVLLLATCVEGGSWHLIEITTSVYGDIPDLHEKASKYGDWLKVTYSQSLLHEDGVDPFKAKGRDLFGRDSKGKLIIPEKAGKIPRVEGPHIVEPFATSDLVPGISPFKRMVMKTVFAADSDVDNGNIQKYYDNLCMKDHRSSAKVLEAALLRAAELSGLYPKEGMQLATSLTRELPPPVNYLAVLYNIKVEFRNLETGKVDENMRCGTDAEDGSDQAIPLLPKCPEHSETCAKHPQSKACTDQPAWLCKCDVGYEGDLRLNDMEYDEQGNIVKDKSGLPRFLGQRRIRYVGECKLKENYCNVEKPWRDKSAEADGNYGKNMFIISPEGQQVNATGVLGEKGAMPECPDDMISSGGTATCTIGDDVDGAEGKWVPFISCAFAVPERPATEPCPALSTWMYTKSCSGCRPRVDEYPEEPFVDCPACNLSCNADNNYRARSGDKEWQPTCKAIVDPCPDSPVWEEDMCREEAGGQEVNRHCCKEAWQYGVRPLKEEDRKCSDIKDKVGCLRARDRESRALCCFKSDGGNSQCFEKSSSPDKDAECGVGPEIWKGVWEGLPDCMQMCENNLIAANEVDAPGCTGKVPDETCHADCMEGFENLGEKDLVGLRTCQETLDFGAPPVCVHKLDQYCEDPASDSLETEDCKNCLALPADAGAGDTEKDSSCQCHVTCKDGYGQKKQQPEEKPGCELVDRPSLTSVETCNGLDREACISSYEDTDAMGRLPCCWASADVSPEGKPSGVCATKHSEKITSTKSGWQCAALKAGVFKNLPICLPYCTNVFAGVKEYKQDLVRNCAHCIPGGSCEDCKVECNDALNLVRFGGPEQGPRRCREDGGFEKGPLCGKRPEEQACKPPSGDFITVTDCEDCFPGPDSTNCRCDVRCKSKDYKAVAGEEGERVCEAHFDNLNNAAECQQHGTMEECLGSRDKISNEPCCWNEDGFTDADSAVKCLAKGHRDMVRLPSAMKDANDLACAPTPLQWSRPIPHCEPYAVRTWVGLSHIKDEGCDGCLLSKETDCKCKVWCESSEKDLRVDFYGGGPEAKGERYRQPQEHRDQDGRPTLGPAPVCLPVPVCSLPPELPEQLLTPECQGVQAGGNCTVNCIGGFAFNVGGKKKDETEWSCLSETHLKSATCEGLSEEECLVSAEDGDPCGFQKGKCHRKGSPDFEASASVSTPRFAHLQWEPAPQCVQLCENIFKSMSLIDSTKGCDACLPDSCDCHVTCKEPFIWIPEGPSQGQKYCKDGQFDWQQVPHCRSQGDQCVKPVDEKKRLSIKGCDDCKAGETCAGCTVDCAPEADRLIKVAGEKGEQMCCPSVVVKVKNKCKNPENKDQIVEDKCCEEAQKENLDLDLADSCTVIQDREICLGSKEKGEKGTPCCWLGERKREQGFACVAASSEEIDNDHLPSACADIEERRGSAMWWWPTWPTCAKKCAHDFDRKELQIKGDGCRESTDWAFGPQKVCNVECAPGFSHYGGGAVGAHTCDRFTATFGPVPLCAKPKCRPPVVAVKEAYKNLHPCNELHVGERCEVSCAEGFGFASGKTVIPQECVESKKEKEHKVRSCWDHHYDKGRCLSGWRGDKPCCWMGDISKSCFEKGSQSITEMPMACADDPTLGDDFPVCKRKCSIKDLRGKQPKWGFDFVSEKTCEECVADDKSCDCRLQCKKGFKRVGGGLEDARHCSSESLEIGDPPMCMDANIVDGIKNSLDPNTDCSEYPGKNVDCPRIGGDMSKCHATCKKGFLPVKGKADEQKKCILIDRRRMFRARVGCWYQRFQSECLKSFEEVGKERVQCCWSAEAGKCFAFGDRTLTHELSQCAQMKELIWEDALDPDESRLLNCQQQCDSSLIKPDPSIVYNKEDCESCIVDKECKCDVQCKDGYEHVGGSAPGRRGCRLYMLRMAGPPVCLKPREPVCDLSDLSVPGPVELTRDCTHEKCQLRCKSGFKGAPTVKECKREPLTLYSNKCNKIGFSGCLQSAEGGVPCCLARQGGRRCFKQGDEDLTSRAVCAVEKKAEWRGEAPTCLGICPNPFKEAATANHYDKESVQGCDGLAHGESCKSLRCGTGTFLPLGKDGRRRTQEIPQQLCSGQELAPRFSEDMPVCKPVCKPPANVDGTLDVSKCKEDCFPRLPGLPACNCKLQCASWTRLTSPLLDPVCTENDDGTAAFTNLIECTPQCTPPGDQDGLLDTSECREPCDAGNGGCKCNLKCKNPKAQTGGGPPGLRTCKPFTEAGTGRRVGRWVLDGCTAQPDDPDSCVAAPPLCMAELIVEVVDATNKKPLEGATVFLADPKQQELDQKKTTDKEGVARLPTSLVLFRVEVEVPETTGAYFKNSQEVDRLDKCEKIYECKITVSMTPRVDEAGIIDEEGCYLVLENGRQKWQMQVSLEWNDKVKDLDLWARQWECADGVVRLFENAEKCYPSEPVNDDCRRTLSNFLNKDNEYVKEQQQACHTEMVWSVKTASGNGYETHMLPETKGPHVRKKSENQYPKWVFHQARLATNLNKKVVADSYNVHRRIVDISEKAKDWNPDHWMLLNVDERSYRGPETLTFRNVPPATYQIWVNVFMEPGVLSEKVGGKDKHGNWVYNFWNGWTRGWVRVAEEASAGASVTLTFGHAGVKVICEVPPECKKEPIGDGSVQANRLWHVADVIIGEKVLDHDGNFKRYSIRIEDREEELKKRPVFALTQPANPDAEAESPSNRKDHGYTYPGYWRYYLSNEFAHACRGQCRLASEHSDKFAACLSKNHKN